MMGFDITVVGSDSSRERFPAARYFVGDDDEYAAVEPADGDFVVIGTQHRGDHESLKQILTTNVGYVALIASRNRAGLVKDYLRTAGFDDGAISRIRSPCGLDLGARTAEEIALSIISEIVLTRRTRSQSV